jgi:hypothetical protein
LFVRLWLGDIAGRPAHDSTYPGYEISQRKRKRIEEVFGWMKTVGMLRQLRHRGLGRVGWVFTLAAATYNLVRMRALMPKCA